MNFSEILEKTQGYISSIFASDPDPEMLQSHVRHFVHQNSFVSTEEEQQLCERLLNEMQGYSILTPLLERSDVEEININRWDDVKITYTNGMTVASKEHFLSPSHAVDIVRRMLLASNMVWDNSRCIQVGHLSGNVRITVAGFDILDKDAALAVSIRKITAANLPREGFINGGTCTADMIDFLRELYTHGVSLCITGSTGSGKTTLLSYLIKNVPVHRRLITVEQGTREFDCVRRDENGTVLNNVIHLQTRLSEDESISITQEKLLETMMTMNPDYIAVGESKGPEAMQAINAANTGHAVITTTHANSCEDTYFRLVSLCKMKYPNMDEHLLTELAVRAFPITVYIKKMEDNTRRILQICESRYEQDKVTTIPLFRFNIHTNSIDGVTGTFEQLGGISEKLCNQLIENGLDTKWLPLFQHRTKPRYRRKETSER